MNAKEKLQQRIKSLDGICFSINTILIDALNDLESKPRVCILECRSVIEVIVGFIINEEQLNKNTDFGRFIVSLDDTRYCPEVTPRIRPRISYIWAMVNSCITLNKLCYDNKQCYYLSIKKSIELQKYPATGVISLPI